MQYIVCLHLIGFPDPDTYSKIDQLMLSKGFYRELLGEYVSDGEITSVQLPNLVYLGGEEDSTCEGLASHFSTHIQPFWSQNRIFAGKITEWATL